MKHISVVAAIILRDDKLFATQRGYGEWKDWWEFPGGKIEVGETPQAALQREIREELDADIEVGELLATVEYDYPKSPQSGTEGFHLSMRCYLCKVVSGRLALLEHEAAKWLLPEELESVRWLPADWEVLPKIRSMLQKSFV